MAEFDNTYPTYINKGYKLRYNLNWKDAYDYNPEHTYKIMDVVRYLGSIFESKINNNTKVPATYDKDNKIIYFNTEYWNILVNNTGDYILNNKIDEIIESNSEITIKIKPEIAFAGEDVTININSYIKTEGIVKNHNISRNSDIIVSGESSVLNCTDTFNTHSNITYISTAIINGKQFQTSNKVIIVEKIYYGSGRTPSDANIQDTTPRETPNGVYNINVMKNGDYIFIDIPNSMQVNTINVNGFVLPYKTVRSSRFGYICYQSTNTYDAGCLVIEMS